MVRKMVKSDPEIFIEEPIPKSISIERAKPGSKRIHLAEKTAWGIRPSCGNQYARLFTFTWTKATCAACLRPRLQEFNKYWDAALDPLKHRREIKEIAADEGITRQQNEKFNAFENRIQQIRLKRWEKEKTRQEHEHLASLGPQNFTTFPLDIQNLDFPLSFPLTLKEIYESMDEYGDDIYGISKVKVTKEKYLEILIKWKVLIESQLTLLLKRTSNGH
jgi:hypothetical protein